MNRENSCNAYWNGSTVNFYREGSGCGNTGEIAAVFDHEWGHGELKRKTKYIICVWNLFIIMRILYLDPSKLLIQVWMLMMLMEVSESFLDNQVQPGLPY